MLEIDGLRCGYGAAEVLRGMDLGVRQGTTLALMGRNGMGKTTLLRAILGLVPARAGRVRFQGRDITGLATHAIARLGLAYVPQGREIFTALSVEDNLRLGLLGRARNGPGERSVPERLYDWFPILGERRQQRAGTLSGGEQQMLAVARALAPRPRMLMLDEPTEGLQPSVVLDLGDILARVAAESGLTVLLVEHSVDLVTKLAESVAFIVDGRVAEVSPAAALGDEGGALNRYLGL